MAAKRRGDANDRAAVNMKKARISRLDGRHPPTPPPLPSLKPRSPRPGLFIAAGVPKNLTKFARHLGSDQQKISRSVLLESTSMLDCGLLHIGRALSK